MSRRAIVAVCVLVLWPAIGSAQIFVGRETPRRGSVEISGGGMAVGGKDLPDVPATLTSNPSVSSEPLELFRANGTILQAVGAQLRVGVYATPRLSLEGGLQYTRPEIGIRITSDFEDAPATTVTGRVTSYLFTGSALYHFGSGKMRPFLIGGGGHVRDVHEGQAVVETGNEFHAGGGFKWWMGTSRRKFGFRVDLIASVRDGGIGTEEGRRVVPTGAVSLAYVY